MFRRMLLSSLAARRARLALGLVAVSLGVGVATALGTLALQVGDDLARTLRAAGPNFVVLPPGSSLPVDLGGVELRPARAGLSLPESAVADLKRGFWKNNILQAAPELALGVRAEHPAAPGAAGEPALVIGTWFRREIPLEGGLWRTGLASLRPHWKVEGRWPGEDADEVALGRDLASRMGLRPGQRLTVRSGGREARWLVSGVVSADPLENARAWAPLARVQELAGREGRIDRVWLSALVKEAPRGRAPDALRDPAGYERFMCTAYPDNVARDVAAAIPGAEVLPMTEVVAGESMVVGRLNLLMILLALAALTASILGLFSTTTATVLERRVEIGLMRALGAGSSQVAALLLGETALVSLAGGMLGWTLGSAGAALIRGETFGSGGAPPLLLLPVAMVLSLSIGALGTLGPLRVALGLDPATVLRG